MSASRVPSVARSRPPSRTDACVPPSGWQLGTAQAWAELEVLPLPTAVFVPSRSGARIVAANDAFARIGGMTMDEPPARAAAALLRGHDEASCSVRWRQGDAVSGRYFDAYLVRVVAAGRLSCMMTLIDRTAEHVGTRSLQAELTHDSLTGLPNRIAFSEAVDELVAGEARHAVLLVDLARFGRINQTLGSTTGDEVIITVARRLLSALRSGDLIARIGGNEFGLLVRIGAEPRAEVTAAATRIRKVLEAPFRLADYEVGIDCAIGCALADHAGEAGEDVVRRALVALKRAKETGRFEIDGQDETDRARLRSEIDIETELRRAIARSELTLAFQPVIRLRDDALVGFEALARWTHPRRGVVAPARFIEVAEETGLIVPLGRWALETALATLARWDAAAGGVLPVSMAVNISAIQFARDDVPALVAQTLAAHGFGGQRLTIELTESAIVRDPDRVTRAMLALKALDTRIAMDDFGTGYSSLLQLRRLPVDILKIDRSFVTGMLQDRDKIAIVRAILSMAAALGKNTTAEGVETFELAQTLAGLGCCAVQGYAYAPPLSEDEALAFARARLR